MTNPVKQGSPRQSHKLSIKTCKRVVFFAIVITGVIAVLATYVDQTPLSLDIRRRVANTDKVRSVTGPVDYRDVQVRALREFGDASGRHFETVVIASGPSGQVQAKLHGSVLANALGKGLKLDELRHVRCVLAVICVLEGPIEVDRGMYVSPDP